MQSTLYTNKNLMGCTNKTLKTRDHSSDVQKQALSLSKVFLLLCLHTIHISANGAISHSWRLFFLTLKLQLNSSSLYLTCSIVSRAILKAPITGMMISVNALRDDPYPLLSVYRWTTYICDPFIFYFSVVRMARLAAGQVTPFLGTLGIQIDRWGKNSS